MDKGGQAREALKAERARLHDELMDLMDQREAAVYAKMQGRSHPYDPADFRRAKEALAEFDRQHPDIARARRVEPDIEDLSR